MIPIEHPWAKSADHILAQLNGNAQGLTEAEAQNRLKDVGPNLLAAKDQDPWYLILAHQFANPLVYMLIGAAVVKGFFKGLVDAYVIGAVLLFMAAIGFIQEMKARKAMQALLSLSAPKAKVRREGRSRLLDAQELVPGDLLLLEAGDRVAADARLWEVASLKTNESAFTGESLPVEKNSAPLADLLSLHDKKNMVFMGTTVIYGRGLAVVTATGMATEIGRIASAVSGQKKQITPLERSIEKLGGVLLWVVSGAALLLAVAGLLHGMSAVDVLLLSVAAAVSGIPEGLPAAVTIVLSLCVSRMAQRNVIIRKMAAVETLGATTLICSDKTGTLTVNQMTVQGVWVGNRSWSVSGAGYSLEGALSPEGHSLPATQDETVMQLCRGAALCNDALLEKSPQGWTIFGDPTEGSLLTLAGKLGLKKAELEAVSPRLDELPFESEKQCMVTLHGEKGVRLAYIKGSVEKLLTMAGHWRTPQGDQALDAEALALWEKANQSMASKAWRVLAVAVAPYPLELGKLSHEKLKGRLVLLGLVGMMDPPRDEARRAIEACQGAGIEVAMITGDNPLTAQAIAEKLSLNPSGARAITGRDIDTLDDAQLLEICRTTRVFARIEPLHKLRIVKTFQRIGHVTAMTGDGVNDAPALEASHIGIAMGITGTDVAKEAADMVLADDNFSSIVNAVEEGRIIFNRLRAATFFLLMTCTGELLTFFFSISLFGVSPLVPIQILWVNLVTGALVAIPLGMEPGTGDELKQPPRDARVGLVYPGLIFRILIAGAAMSVLVTSIFHFAPLPLPAEGFSQQTARQTIAFTAIVVFEWLFAFQARSTEKGVLQLGLLRNPWLVMCLCVGLTLQVCVVYLPWAHKIFHTCPLSFEEWLWVLIPGVTVTLLEGVRKSLAPNLFRAGQWKPWVPAKESVWSKFF